MLSRADAGVVGRALVFLLPGSPAAVRLAVRRLIVARAGARGRPAAPRTTHHHSRAMAITMALSTAAGVAARAVLSRSPAARVIDYLRVSVTDRCNYRCTYCMPEDGVDARRARRRPVVRGDRARWSPASRRWAYAACASPAASRRCAAIWSRWCACCARCRASTRSRCRPTATCWPSWRRPCARRASIASTSASTRWTRSASGASPPRRSGARARRASRPRAPRASRRSSSTPSPCSGFNDDELGRICASPGSATSSPASSSRCRWRTAARTCPGALLAAAEIRARVAAAHARARARRRRRGSARGAGPGALLPPRRRRRRRGAGARASGSSRR